MRGFTLGNAIAGGIAGRRGRIAPGFDADLVAWEVDDLWSEALAERFSAPGRS